MVRRRYRPVDPRWLLVGAVAAALLVAAVLPTSDTVARTGPFGIRLDLWLHAIGYAALQVTALAAIAGDSDPPLSIRETPVAVVGYGLLLEGVQLLVPYRTGSLADALANAVGVVFALICWHLLVRLR